MNGTILWFRNDLGYGFIKDDETNEEMYFHWSDITREGDYKTAFSGEGASFERFEDEHGKVCAHNVTIQKRVNKNNGKPICLVAYLDLRNEKHCNALNFRINRLQGVGLQNINSNSNFLVASDRGLKKNELNLIIEAILNNYEEIEERLNKGMRKLIEFESLEFDAIFL